MGKFIVIEETEFAGKLRKKGETVTSSEELSEKYPKLFAKFNEKAIDKEALKDNVEDVVAGVLEDFETRLATVEASDEENKTSIEGVKSDIETLKTEAKNLKEAIEKIVASVQEVKNGLAAVSENKVRDDSQSALAGEIVKSKATK